MSKPLRFYELSGMADSDIDEIFDFTKEQFGFEQAIKYLAELENVFIQLLISPKMGKERFEIKQGLRSIAETSHVIFYRIMNDRIRIVRVLHGSRDLRNFL